MVCENPFTVLLLYPDYIASNFGHETYMCTVNAPDAREAITLARTQAMQANETCDDGEDFHVLLVIAGEHNDIKPV